MELQAIFKFLNYERITKKDGKGEFIKLNFLDGNLTPCTFFSFDDELSNKITLSQLNAFQDITVKFSLVYSNNMWRVNLLDIILK